MDRVEYTLIGAGGTGSHFIGPALAYLNSYHRNKGEPWAFHIVDGDAYEKKNLERQMFAPELVGINKAAALAEMYKQYPVDAIDRFIGREDMETLIRENDIVFIGVDNYSLRALVEERGLAMKNVTVLNAGNEKSDGSVQLWVRRGGRNKTPRLSYGHPEIAYIGKDDRAFMTCAEVAAMPGGEQLILANMAAAQHMLSGLWRLHTGAWKKGWTELQFDLVEQMVEHIDMRLRRNWDKDGDPKVRQAQKKLAIL